ncbi:MAG: hypothetical protein HWD59_03860 [Coxiellaceae bacterium]|nr:MAG: hypothetical protein HWD59_03860 [Coxiellaceae bacterium]
MGTAKIMMKSLPEEVSARVLAAIFSVSFTYLLPKLVANPLVGIFDAIRCKANGLPIDWLPFQLAPKFMVAAIIIGAIATSLSFSSVLSLYLSAYHFIFKEALSYEVIAVIDLFI